MSATLLALSGGECYSQKGERFKQFFYNDLSIFSVTLW